MHSLLRSILFIALLTTSFAAQSQSWTRFTGLPIKSYYSLEVLGTLMYAGTTDTMYFSKDKGVTWTMRKLPTSGYRVQAFTSFVGRLFVGTGDGVYMSSDTGRTWAASNIHVGINQFAQWNGDLYAATDGGGVFQCSRVSNTWSPFNSNLPTSTSGKLIRILNDGSTLVTATAAYGAWYRWAYGSSHWDEFYFNGSSADPSMYVYDFIKDGTPMFVQTNNGWLLRSDDSGMHWTPDATDMRGGDNGVMLQGYYKLYAIWNGTGGAWIQSRDRSEPALNSWSTGEEFFTSGQVRMAREYDRKLILATDNGVYWKVNGSPSAGISSTTIAPKVDVFPNPLSKGSATIRANDLTRILVFDAMGRLVKDHSIKASQYQLQIAQPGIYHLKIQVQGQWVSRQLQVL
jgi:hypothetical protein